VNRCPGRASIAALVLVAASCGCSHEAVVDLTIIVDPSVPAAVVAEVRSIELDVSGLFTHMQNDPLSRPFAAGGTERIVIRSPIGGDVTLDVAALDEAGTALLTGETTFTLRTGATSAQSVTVTLATSGADGGVDSDLGAVADLAVPPNADLAVAPDLGTVVCPSGVLLCDGFESGTVSGILWDYGVTQSNASVTVDQTHVHRGQYALHVHTNIVASSGSAEATVAESHTFSPPGATFWARAFYYLPSSWSTSVATLLDASQKATPFNDVSLAIDHDALSIYNAFNGGSYVASTTPLLALDKWVCIEWEVDTGTPNQLHAWVDGQPVTALDLMQPTTAAQPIGVFSVGLGIFPPNTSPIALDAWVDDVIFDHAPIGCAK
jgi:hypothetical protein